MPNAPTSPLDRQSSKGFTIVELLIVIVVIAILAALTFVTYNGIQNRARISVIHSDLSTSSKRLEAYKTTASNSERYPAGNDCTPSPATDTICLTSSQDVVLSYTYGSNGTTYCLQASLSDLHYYISPQTGKPTQGTCPVVISKAVSGNTHGLALTNTGKVYVWGRNNYGQLGDGTATQSTTPKIVAALEDQFIIDIAAGTQFSFALSNTGTIYAWGQGTNGQLGNGSNTNQTTPVTVVKSGVLSGKTIIGISTFIYGGFAIASDGTGYSWGANQYGQLGDGTTNASNVPVAINMTGALAGESIVSISGGGSFIHTLALTASGKLFAWGKNTYGQLGNGTTTDSINPIEITASGPLSGKKVTSIAAGSELSLAITNDGALYQWGAVSGVGNFTTPNNITGQGTLAGRVPYLVRAASNIGGAYALTTDGALHAWGGNDYGNVGDGTTTLRTVPVLTNTSGVLLGKTIVDIQSSSTTPIARTADGEIFSWGSGSYGALGNGGTSNSSVPVSVTKTW